MQKAQGPGERRPSAREDGGVYLGSSLRSPAEGEGHEGFPPPPEKDLEPGNSTPGNTALGTALALSCWGLAGACPIYLPGSDGTGCHDLRFLNVEL